MNISSLLPLLSTVFVFILGNFVFWGGKKKKLNVIFSLFCLGSTIWFFGTFMMFLKRDEPAVALLWDRFVYLGVIFLPVLMYHLSLLLANRKETKTLYFGYIVLSIFLILSRTTYFLDGIYVYPWGVHGQARILHHAFLVIFFIYVLLFYFTLYPYYKKTNNKLEKLKLRYVLAAFFILTFGGLGYLPAYGINIYPFAYFFGVIFASIFVYTIVRHRFMDIRIVTGKIVSYIFIAAFVYGAFYGVLGLQTTLFGGVFVRDAYWFGIPLALGFSLLFFPVQKLVQKLTKHYIFADLYNAQETIGNLTNKLTTIIDLNQVIDLVVGTIKSTMNLNRSGVLLIEANVTPVKYKIARVVGFDEHNGISLVQDNFLTQYLTKTQKPLVKEELDFLSDQSQDQAEKAGFMTLKKHMEKIEASLCLPLISQNQLVGIIVLGAKLSGDAYTSEDLNLLASLSNQASIAITNARLYSETQSFNNRLQTEIKKATTDLVKANEHLKQLDVAKSEFLTIASHQLRTPLTAIKGYLSMFLEGDFGQLPDNQSKVMKDMFESSARLARIINTFLDVSKIDSGPLKLDKTMISLSELAGAVVTELANTASKKKLKLNYKKPKIDPGLILGDKDKIKDVLLNLTDNAIKYTLAGSVTIYLEKKESMLEVRVEDTGIGLDPQDAEKLFEKFSRGDGIAQIDTTGSGLGLYIGKRIIEAHGGKIWVESAGKGKGSKFIFTLPI